MTPDISRCDHCGTALSSSEAEGLCPRCLIGLAMMAPTLPDAALRSGERVGPYEIVSLISRGGMGEVYRARDTRLDRIVALKFLSTGVVESVARRDRFEREARAVSRVNHPNICSLYDVGEHHDCPFLVMEFVEGVTLAERLAKGPLPIEDLARHAVDIVDALAHAHGHGIIHRDLKPANIMLTPAGVKLLDFGVAKLRSRVPIESGTVAVTQSMQAVTEDGTIVGTLQYMSPEQLEGGDADQRTDIFAIGAVLYEMATGNQAFTGSSRTGVRNAILDRDPAPPSLLRRGLPSALDEIVARCLAKRPDRRWQTAADLGRALMQLTTPRQTSRVWRAVAAAAVTMLVAIALTNVASRRSAAGLKPFRFIVPPPENASFSQSSAFMAVSPDGHSLAFVASTPDGQNAVWVRSLDSLSARQLPATSGGSQPFWSSDSRSLAFGVLGATDTLKRIDVASGLPQTIAGSRAAPGAWNNDGVMLFAGGRQEGGVLYRISPNGGTPVAMTALDKERAETSHSWPQFLPDGRHFLFLARSANAEYDGVTYVGSVDSMDRTRIVKADSQAVFAPQGYLLFLQVHTLLAQAFDPGTRRLSGEPIPIAEQVERTPGSYRGAFSISRTGVLAYRQIGETRLGWYDRAGRHIQWVGAPGHYSNPALSPDEQRIAVARLDPETGTSDVWVIDQARGGLASRVTFDTATEEMPLWSPDGNHIVFRSPAGLFRGLANGTPGSELLSSTIRGALDWLRDGETLLAYARRPETGLDVLMLPTSRTPVAILQSEFQEGYANLSPDGRWIAYVSDESGKYEVYVQAFPSGESKRRISTEGGFEPTWSADGRVLFYLAPDRSLMSVAVDGRATTLDAQLPERLFDTRMSAVFNPSYTRNQYVVSRDGSILINQPAPGSAGSPISVVVNWHAALQQ